MNRRRDDRIFIRREQNPITTILSWVIVGVTIMICVCAFMVSAAKAEPYFNHATGEWLDTD